MRISALTGTWIAGLAIACGSTGGGSGDGVGPTTGGSSSGGSPSGGASSGGGSNSGGSNASTGGANTGGTGGCATGGSSTGGSNASTGGSSSGGTGGSNTGGTGMGGMGGFIDACISTTVAAGTPKMIDSFEATYADPAFQALPANDGRVGDWSHSTFLTPSGGGLKEVKSETTNHFLNFSCVDGDTDNSAQCNTDWDKTKPWEQWASLDVGLQPWSPSGYQCYNASKFTGIRVKARSASGLDKLRVIVVTPDANPDYGETYQSPTLSLTSAWADYEIPFAQIQQPAWSSVKAPLNEKELVAFSLVVRTVEAKTAAADGADGEKLLPYSIDIDDVQFY